MTVHADSACGGNSVQPGEVELTAFRGALRPLQMASGLPEGSHRKDCHWLPDSS